MSKKAKSTLRLFVEGFEIDLTEGESLKNGLTYGLASVKDISKKTSNMSKSITIPGTVNNNKLFDFFWDARSTGNSTYTIPVGSAKISNSISGLTVVTMSVDSSTYSTSSFTPDPSLGFTFSFPVNNGGSTTSFHNAIPSTGFSFVTSGSASGYAVCKLNGTVISCNQVLPSVSKYYFPVDNYLFDDYLEIDFQTAVAQFTGNIGYAFDPMKKAKAVVMEDGQILMSGYARMMEATSKNGLITYTLSIVSEVGGLTSALGNSRLEDLFTTTVPNLVLDPTGQTSEVIDLPSPFDFQFTIPQIVNSWRGEESYVVPLIDYGGNGDDKQANRSDLTVYHTNFYTSTLRPCLRAKSYIDLIFQSVGYTYESNFLNSDYAKSLIIPFCDGNFTNIDQYAVEATTNLSGSGLTIALNYSTPLSESIFNEVISDNFKVYNTSSLAYVAPYQGIYNFSTDFTFNFNFTPTDTTDFLLSPAMTLNINYNVYNSSNVLYTSSYDFIEYLDGAISVFGVRQFKGVQTSDNINLSFSATSLNLNQGDYVKVYVTPTIQNPSPNVFKKAIAGYSDGSVTLSIINANGIEPFFFVSLSPNIDGQYVRYKDYVPKSIKCKEFITSFFQLFNLYPVQSVDRPRHLEVYSRDEFFSQQNAIDWNGKLDINSSVTVKPAAPFGKQLLFSYKKATDYWNKLYDSYYGNFSYGSLRIDTGDQWSNEVKDVLKGTLFSPTPSIQYQPLQTLGESTIEILNAGGVSGSSSNRISVSGYNSSTGNFSGTPFTFAKKGVSIIYDGIKYLIDEVDNPYTFTVTDLNGSTTTLLRSAGQINNTYVCQYDNFYYYTNCDLIIPAIYESSDNNNTHKPTKTNLRILYFKPLAVDSPYTNSYFWIQYTPTLNKTTNQYYYWNGDTTTKGSAIDWNQYPYCGHLSPDPINPTHDLLFAPPVATFFNQSFTYPTKSLYTKYWINTISEMADPENRFMECSLKLNGVDISNLDLSVPVSIGSVNYRINSIKDYTGDASKLTPCELVKIPRYYQTSDTPIVYAGPDQSFNLPQTGSNFAGTVTVDSTSGGAIQKVIWSQLSGPVSAIIANSASLSSSFSGLATGSYTFQLFAEDNFGLVGTDTMAVTLSARVPCTPSAIVSNNGPITIPSVTSVSLSGSSSSGCNLSTITGSLWSFVSGPMTPSITAAGSLNTTATGFTSSGSYVFNLSITDNYGESNNANTTVTVSALPLVLIQNNTGNGSISGETGITGFTSTSVLAGHTVSGSHTGFTGTITVTFASPETLSSTLTLYKNLAPLQAISIGAGVGTNQTFGSQTFLSTDYLQITWN